MAVYKDASEGSASDDVEGIEWRIYVKKKITIHYIHLVFGDFTDTF